MATEIKTTTGQGLTVFIVRPEIFKEMTQEEAQLARIGIKTTSFLGIDMPLPPSAWTVGTSLREIYEQTLGRKCGYGGAHADAYILQELEIWGVVPILVKPEEFKQLMKIPDEKRETTIREIFQLPL